MEAEAAVAEKGMDDPGIVTILTSCPCGYRLTGLPARGRCPECAVAYEKPLVVMLFGSPRSWGTVEFAASPAYALLYVMAQMGTSFNWLYGIALLFFEPALFRIAEIFGRTSFVRLSEDGCEQSAILSISKAITPMRIVAWGIVCFFLTWYFVVAVRAGDRSAQAFFILILGIVLFRKRWLLRAALRKEDLEADGTSIARRLGLVFLEPLRMAPPTRLNWQSLRACQFTQKHPGRFRLTISERNAFPTKPGGVIDLEIDADLREVEHLKAHLETFSAIRSADAS